MKCGDVVLYNKTELVKVIGLQLSLSKAKIRLQDGSIKMVSLSLLEPKKETSILDMCQGDQVAKTTSPAKLVKAIYKYTKANGELPFSQIQEEFRKTGKIELYSQSVIKELLAITKDDCLVSHYYMRLRMENDEFQHGVLLKYMLLYCLLDSSKEPADIEISCKAEKQKDVNNGIGYYFLPVLIENCSKEHPYIDFFDMLAKAVKRNPNIPFIVDDVVEWAKPVKGIISNDGMKWYGDIMSSIIMSTVVTVRDFESFCKYAALTGLLLQCEKSGWNSVEEDEVVNAIIAVATMLITAEDGEKLFDSSRFFKEISSYVKTDISLRNKEAIKKYVINEVLDLENGAAESVFNLKPLLSDSTRIYTIGTENNGITNRLVSIMVDALANSYMVLDQEKVNSEGEHPQLKFIREVAEKCVSIGQLQKEAVLMDFVRRCRTEVLMTKELFLEIARCYGYGEFKTVEPLMKELKPFGFVCHFEEGQNLIAADGSWWGLYRLYVNKVMLKDEYVYENPWNTYLVDQFFKEMKSESRIIEFNGTYYTQSFFQSVSDNDSEAVVDCVGKYLSNGNVFVSAYAISRELKKSGRLESLPLALIEYVVSSRMNMSKTKLDSNSPYVFFSDYNDSKAKHRLISNMLAMRNGRLTIEEIQSYLLEEHQVQWSKPKIIYFIQETCPGFLSSGSCPYYSSELDMIFKSEDDYLDYIYS